MKETGLMFKAPLVRSILDGTKTQTRRVVKNQPFDRSWSTKGHKIGYMSGRAANGDEVDGLIAYSESSGGEWQARCPVGQPGDRIYVRETWQGPLLEEFESDADSDWMSPSRIHQYQNPAHCQYAADGGPAPEFMTADDDLVRRWRPAIHMPKWAARIWLDITGVRLERLQDISEADAKAEGVDAGKYLGLDRAYARAFSELWESTGGNWAANPWVWVIDFKRDLAPKAQP